MKKGTGTTDLTGDITQINADEGTAICVHRRSISLVEGSKKIETTESPRKVRISGGILRISGHPRANTFSLGLVRFTSDDLGLPRVIGTARRHGCPPCPSRAAVPTTFPPAEGSLTDGDRWCLMATDGVRRGKKAISRMAPDRCGLVGVGRDWSGLVGRR